MHAQNLPRREHLGRQLETALRSILVGRVCILGIGNRLRGDDGAGPCVIDKRRPQTRGLWLDAGVTPENLLEPIARSSPQTVLIVDATAFGGRGGECRLLDIAQVESGCPSTHAGSLGLLGDYLACRSQAHTYVLAIQPVMIDTIEGLSQPVATSVCELALMLSEILVLNG